MGSRDRGPADFLGCFAGDSELEVLLVQPGTRHDRHLQRPRRCEGGGEEGRRGEVGGGYGMGNGKRTGRGDQSFFRAALKGRVSKVARHI